MIQSELGRESASQIGTAWLFMGLVIVSVLARVAAQVSMVRLGQDAVAKLSFHLVGCTLRLPLQRFEAIDVNALMTVLTQDIVIIANALIGVPQLCINIPIVLACIVYVGWLSPLLLVCGLTFVAVSIPVYMLLSATAVAGLREARAKQDVLVGLYRTLTTGFRELKLHAGRRRAFISEQLEPTIAAVRDGTGRGLTTFAVAEGWSQLAFFGFLGLLLFIAPRLQSIPKPSLTAAVLVVLYLMTPIDIILTWIPALGRARASLLKVEALLPTLQDKVLAEEWPGSVSGTLTMRATVQVQGAAFQYEDESGQSGFRLGPVDLVLRAGEMVILAGGNGSGKTTLVKLLSGLYPPVAGLVRVDGRPLREDEREAYRQLFTVVFADGHLFPDLHGLYPEGLERKVQEGLALMGLDDRVVLKSGRYSTVDLSQGQKRRLALLNALLEDRPIYIFDEWAANQDANFKRIFYLEMLPSLRAEGKALLVISHDEDYFDVADRVLRLQDGRLIEGSFTTPHGLCPTPAQEGATR